MNCPLCGDEEHLCQCSIEPPRPPAPTIEDYCSSEGHPYYGDDGPVHSDLALIGRCYCGTRLWPAGGPGHPARALAFSYALLGPPGDPARALAYAYSTS
jgi:hypothetical protein